jgi:hypothetical protein
MAFAMTDDDTFAAACARADKKRAASEREDPSTLRARRLLDDSVSIGRELNDPRNHPTPKATVEAIMHCVRTRGLAALKAPANLERLSRCDAAAKAEINERIEKLGLES